MARLILIAFLAFSINVIAQPQIPNGSNFPAPGFTAPLSSASVTSAIGNAGANQTWNFSSLSFSPMGTLNVIAPASSPIGSSFPTANHSYSLSGTYSFFNVSATRLECQAYFIASPGAGNDLSPNPITLLKFPFNYLDTETDIWQRVNGTINTVTLTYDGYGTLITPTKTYTNIVRIKEDHGSSIDYRWYSLNPLMFIMTYNNNDNLLYYVDANVTGVLEQRNKEIALNIYPNPSKEKISLQISDYNFSEKLFLTVFSSIGQAVQKFTIDHTKTTVEIENLNAGIYFYQLANSAGVLKSGKIIFE